MSTPLTNLDFPGLYPTVETRTDARTALAWLHGFLLATCWQEESGTFQVRVVDGKIEYVNRYLDCAPDIGWQPMIPTDEVATCDGT